MKKPIAANALLGGLIVGAMLIAAIMGAFWTPHDPLKINFIARLKPPGGDFLLGTDEFGRDELSRLLAGASSSVWISLLTVTFAIVAGTVSDVSATLVASTMRRAFVRG